MKVPGLDLRFKRREPNVTNEWIHGKCNDCGFERMTGFCACCGRRFCSKCSEKEVYRLGYETGRVVCFDCTSTGKTNGRFKVARVVTV